MGAALKRRQAAVEGLLAEDERRQLAESGWLVLNRVLEAAQVERLHAAWERAMAQPGDRTRESNCGPDLAGDPEVEVCLQHPRVLEACRVLLGPDIRVAGCHGRAPAPGHGGQGLHVDWTGPVLPGELQLANAFWVLDPMDAHNGATRIVPGSHRWGRVPRGTLAQPHGRHPQEQQVEARPGDVLVFSAHLWHAGAVNPSGRRRRVLLMQVKRG
jgi:ectoine hydroxylase-related dioxygenase (phytanoyl-CoA dioxygenase family)